MDKLSNLNYKWFWISGLIAFILSILLIVFGIWKLLLVVVITAIGLGIGLVVDLFIIRGKEEKKPDIEEEEEE